MAVYKGRGVLSLDAVSVGNCPSLTLNIETESFQKWSATSSEPVPVLDGVAQIPKRITITAVIPEYTGDNLRALTCGDGAGGTVEIVADTDQEYEITFDGVNCLTSTDFDFVGYKFVPLAVTSLGLIEEGFAAAELTGILLADSSKTGSGISKYGKFTVA